MIEPSWSNRIAGVEHQLRLQLGVLAAAVLCVTVTLLGGFALVASGVIRTRGIVIVDEQGRERILIGAPIPSAGNWLRTSIARAERTWASRFPDPKQHMRWYAGYRHSMHGMLVRDEQRQDRLAIGDSTPDPSIGNALGRAPSSS